MSKLLYSIPDAANQLSLSVRTVERLIADGVLKTVRPGRRRLVPHDSLEAYVAELKKAA